ncbi:site-2 protease family protein [Rubrivirga sp. S365]|uniref:site-2 protease family protein n=1 Tax=Rubrivirga sp. S365 TaxID=3076080 RepID=UPI0028C9AF48|nr:site-2 protease family protein [Rubrivirga sp. S365]MDT7856185.1 site-2 protease family protein [Rubrivirga sp. S365]
MPDPPRPRASDRTAGGGHREAGAESVLTDYTPPAAEPARDRLWVHALLFALTFASMVWAGGALVGRAMLWPTEPAAWPFLDATGLSLLGDPDFVRDGLLYAVPFLLFLTVHEFGHYVAARVVKTRVSLPYYIPIPLLGSLGTFGAVIRIKEPLRRTRQLFDIGAAGPLAGFVVAVGVLVAAVYALPPAEYLLAVPGHLEEAAALAQTGALPAFDAAAVAPGSQALVFGDTPLFHLLSGLGAYRVPGHEIMHYPVLLAGWLGLFFTALNLLPVGQLDGGHVVYALFGPAVHRVVARVTTILLLLSGGVGLVTTPGAGWTWWLALGLLYALAFARLFDGVWSLVASAVGGALALTALVVFATPGLAAAVGYTGWLVWIGLILLVVRVDHPPVQVREPLTPARKALGYLCLVIFALCFSIQPIQFVMG